jgi:hypothetical protein
MPEGIILRTPELPQSEIARDDKHHNNNTNDVKNIVHVNFSFLRFGRIIYNLQVNLD